MEETVDSLRRELALAEKEKNSYESLWRASRDAVRSLEDELKTYREVRFDVDAGGAKREYSSAVRVLESELAAALKDADSKEERVRTLSNERERLNGALVEREKSIRELSRKESELNAEIERLQKETAAYRRNAEELATEIDSCRRDADIHAKRELESRRKVFEALRLVDMAIAERDAAIEREKVLDDEKSRLSRQLSDVLKESTARVQKEIDIAKQNYNEKLSDMLVHIQRLELEMSEKDLSLERASRECALLEERIQSFHKRTTVDGDGKEDKILALEQKLEATFQQLILSERRNIQIVSEKENLQMDYDQLTSGFRRDRKKREWEEKLYSNEINGLRAQISNLKDTLDEAHKTIQDLQADIIFKENLEEKSAIDRMCLTKEFEKHFETQRKLNARWKGSVREIIIKLETTIENLHRENRLLKEENDRLMQTCIK